jgi:hypothetical protein
MFLQKYMGTENFCPRHQAAHWIKHVWGSDVSYNANLVCSLVHSEMANVGISTRVYSSLPGPLVRYGQTAWNAVVVPG